MKRSLLFGLFFTLAFTASANAQQAAVLKEMQNDFIKTADALKANAKALVARASTGNPPICGVGARTTAQSLNAQIGKIDEFTAFVKACPDVAMGGLGAEMDTSGTNIDKGAQADVAGGIMAKSRMAGEAETSFKTRVEEPLKSAGDYLKKVDGMLSASVKQSDKCPTPDLENGYKKGKEQLAKLNELASKMRGYFTTQRTALAAQGTKVAADNSLDAKIVLVSAGKNKSLAQDPAWAKDCQPKAAAK